MSKKKSKKFVPAKSWHLKKFNEKNPGFNGIQLRARQIREQKRVANLNCAELNLGYEK